MLKGRIFPARGILSVYPGHTLGAVAFYASARPTLVSPSTPWKLAYVGLHETPPCCKIAILSADTLLRGVADFSDHFVAFLSPSSSLSLHSLLLPFCFCFLSPKIRSCIAACGATNSTRDRSRWVGNTNFRRRFGEAEAKLYRSH